MNKSSTLLCVILSVFAGSLSAWDVLPPKHMPNQLLIKLYDLQDTSMIKTNSLLQGIELISTSQKIIKINLKPSEFSEQQQANILVKTLGQYIDIIQLNHRTYLRDTTPNDVRFNAQASFWNLVEAQKAWIKTQGGITKNGDTIILALIDDGLDTAHIDLQANLWKNHQEVPNDGIDNDNNGYVDDYYGWNSYNNSGNLIDQSEKAKHGTSVAGLMGADGNNGIGITGGNWNVKIMGIVGGSFSESENIKAFEYVLKMKKAYLESNGTKGAFIVALNCSWGIGGKFAKDAPLWCAYLDTLGKYGITTVASTTNSNVNVDVSGDLPTLCSSNHLIAVNNVNGESGLKVNSGYSISNVDIAAPGDGTYSLCIQPHGNCPVPYKSFSGTSAASPIVTAAIGLLYSYGCDSFNQLSFTNPAQASLLAIQFIKQGADTSGDLKNENAVGGRVNYNGALNAMDSWCSKITTVKNIPYLNQEMVALFPNPNQGSFSLTAVKNIQSLFVFNSTGKKIFEDTKLDTKQYAMSLKVPSGIYIVQISIANQLISKKIIVE